MISGGLSSTRQNEIQSRRKVLERIQRRINAPTRPQITGEEDIIAIPLTTSLPALFTARKRQDCRFNQFRLDALCFQPTLRPRRNHNRLICK